MKRKFLSAIGSILFIFISMIFGPWPSEGVRAVFGGDGESSKDWIIVFNNSVSDPEAEAGVLGGKHNLEKKHIYKHALKGMAAGIPDSKLDQVKQDPKVAYVYPDLEISLDGFTIEPFFRPEVYEGASRRVTHMLPDLPLPLPGTNCSLDLYDQCFTELPENMGEGVGIAIFDTGIDSLHPDLMMGGVQSIQQFHDCVPGTGQEDLQYHGTYVAGPIYGQPNEFGIIGLAPEATLWDIRVMDTNYKADEFLRGRLKGILCGLDFVTKNAPANGGGIQVASMSLHVSNTKLMPKPHPDDCGQTPGEEDAFHQALCAFRDAGGIVVAAAGNQHSPTSTIFPGGYDDAVITVSALANSSAVPISPPGVKPPELNLRHCVDGRFPEFGILPDSTFMTFSNYGPEVDLAAPGCNVGTTLPTYQQFWEHWLNRFIKQDGGNVFKKNNPNEPVNFAYEFGNGTSIATPMVAAGAALWINKNRELFESLPYEARMSRVRDGLVAIAEHIDSEICAFPEDLSKAECPHVNYRIPAPDESPDNVHVHPEPVLDVRSLLEL